MNIAAQEVKKDQYALQFEKDFGVSIEDFWCPEEGFLWDEFMYFLKIKYPDYLNYATPKQLELAKIGQECADMCDVFGAM